MSFKPNMVKLILLPFTTVPCVFKNIWKINFEPNKKDQKPIYENKPPNVTKKTTYTSSRIEIISDTSLTVASAKNNIKEVKKNAKN